MRTSTSVGGSTGPGTPSAWVARRRSSRAPAVPAAGPPGSRASNAAHGSSASAPRRRRQRRDLVGGEHRGVVERIARERQPPALDGVGEDDAGPVRSASASSRTRTSESMSWPPRSEMSRGSVGVVASPEHLARGRPGPPASAPSTSRVPLLRAGPADERPGTPRWASRRCAAGGSRRPARVERRLEPAAVLGLQHLPAGGPEHLLQAPDADARHDPVEALPIEVHEHGHVAQPWQRVLQHGLPDVALVQLGVADGGHEAAVGPRGRPRPRMMRAQVLVGERREHRRHGAQAHRPGREVDPVGVLGPRRVRLEAAELAQLAQPLARRGRPSGTAASDRPGSSGA